MAELILGPVLRYVSDTEAIVWVETDSDKIIRPSHGWLWIHQANWPDA